MLRCGIYCNRPAIILASLIFSLPEITYTKIHPHFKIGHSSFKVLFAALSKSCILFHFKGKTFCILILFCKQIHDLLLTHRRLLVVPQSVKIISVSAIIGKIGKPVPGNKSCPLIKEFSISHLSASGYDFTPLPRISLCITAPPVPGKRTLLQGKTGNVIFKQRQKACFLYVCNCFFRTMNALKII